MLSVYLNAHFFVAVLATLCLLVGGALSAIAVSVVSCLIWCALSGDFNFLVFFNVIWRGIGITKMAAEILDNFSEELLETDSDSDVGGNGTFQTVLNSPNKVPAASGSRLNRRLFTKTTTREEPRWQPLGDATNPRSPACARTRPSESDTQILILEELKKTNSRLDSFSEHLKTLDGRIKSVEQAQLTISPSSSSSSTDRSAVKEKSPIQSGSKLFDVFMACVLT